MQRSSLLWLGPVPSAPVFHPWSSRGCGMSVVHWVGCQYLACWRSSEESALTPCKHMFRVLVLRMDYGGLWGRMMVSWVVLEVYKSTYIFTQYSIPLCTYHLISMENSFNIARPIVTSIIRSLWGTHWLPSRLSAFGRLRFSVYSIASQVWSECCTCRNS